jgi:hypothetical protein
MAKKKSIRYDCRIYALPHSEASALLKSLIDHGRRRKPKSEKPPASR